MKQRTLLEWEYQDDYNARCSTYRAWKIGENGPWVLERLMGTSKVERIGKYPSLESAAQAVKV